MAKTVDNGTLTDYDVATAAGVVDADTQRVTLASDDPAVVALQLIDNAIAGSEMQVDVVTSALPTGASTAANQATVIGHLDGVEGLLTTIDTDTGGIATSAATIAGAVSGTEMQVDVVTMPTVTVQDGGGSLTVDGTVAVTGTVDLGATDNAVLDAMAASLAIVDNVVYGAGTEAAALRVTLATDSTGVVSVDDGGGSLTVDGTVAVSGTVAVTDNAASLTVDAPVATPVFVRLSDGSSAITTLPVSVASVPSHAVTNAGTFAVQAAQSGTWNVTNVSGTVSLPTGASTAANQSTIIGHVDGIETLLGTIDADTGALAATVSGTEVQVDVVAALPAGTNAIGKLAANSGVDIGDVDVTSLVPGTSATSLGKAVDSVAGATDTGVAILAIRDDALTTLTPIDGDYTPLRVSSTGALHVTGASGTQYAEDAAHVSGDTGTMALAVRKDTATQLAGTDGDYTPLITDASGALHVAVASGSVTATGSISIATATTGGYTPSKLIDIDETEDEVKASAGTVAGWVLTNLAASTRYVKFYNATAANVTVGTTTPVITIAIPAGAGVVMPVGAPGIAFGTAICVAATTGVADADTGAPGANEIVGTVFYT